MGVLDGRVAIVTGAGRGLGRAHALHLAAEGAQVVVNDLGSGPDGSGTDGTSAEQVVEEILASGGEAVASTHDCTDFAQAGAIIDTALEAFGDLHILVNNAGILRDRRLCNMAEDEWDDVIRVHLKGAFAPTHHAASWWRSRWRAGAAVRASVVNTTSTSGLIGNVGQTNYGAAKAGIAAFTVIAAQEMADMGVRVNAIAPAARTRLTEQTPGLGDMVRPPEDPSVFDVWDPDHASPLVVWLATEACPVTGRVFFVQGGEVKLFQGWTVVSSVQRDGRWTVDQLDEAIPKLLD
jgi:NAD(P)-dependent dehydrogenase (short-subunit alcohol dehydrogenase family)